MAQLVDPAQLSRTERHHLVNIAAHRFTRERNGFRSFGAGARITLKMFNRLQELGLVREVNEHGRKTVALTGNGRSTLGILEERQAR